MIPAVLTSFFVNERGQVVSEAGRQGNWQALCQSQRPVIIVFVLVVCFYCTMAVSNPATAFELTTHYNVSEHAASYDSSVPILPSSLQVAVAANFAKPLRDIAKGYYEKSGQEISVTVSSSGTLFAQLTHGAQFDVFLSADTARPNALIEAGRVNAEDVHVYAKGRLAFLSSNSSASTPHFTADILAGKKLAIANPKLAPYGEAAKQYLAKTKQWSIVAPHLVMGKNVLQAYQFYTTGNADYALVAYSLTLNAELNSGADEPNTNRRNRNEIILIPDTLHQPIMQSLAVTATANRKAAASAFARYLLSGAVQENLPNWGYEPADDSISVNVNANADEPKREINKAAKQKSKRVNNSAMRGLQ